MSGEAPDCMEHVPRDVPKLTHFRRQQSGEGVLAGIGSTPLIELSNVVPPGSARILAKLEWANPTGSMKDRMAAAAIRGAEERGDLVPGDTVVEYTAGTTGISLALVCAAKGYGLHVVFPTRSAQRNVEPWRPWGPSWKVCQVIKDGSPNN